MTEELFREDPYAQRCEAEVTAALDGGVCLDRTVFYCRGGGQPGDRGRLLLAGGPALEVVDTTKAEGRIAHRLAEGSRVPAVRANVVAEIDWSRRHRLMRMHSAMHLLCAAVACPVTGGQVGADKSRLDFDLQGASVDKDEIALRVARWIAEDRPIRFMWIDAAELDARPELVKTMSVRPPIGAGRVRLVEIEGVDLQACGGTHVRSTGEIGALTVGKVENKGRQNRRISLTLVE
ncbi:MAG TPA: alanyl-tRNA editing protein [Geminicoccaceae bacterium]|nr:alanyl-tRNA editing protein [Geminicoccaceae bacterium]